LKFHGDQFFVKSPQQMKQVFGEVPTLLTRTMGIAERCNVKLEKVGNPFPRFDVPARFDANSYFEHVTREGMARRMASLRVQEQKGTLRKSISDYEQRLAFEIEMIQRMNFAGYFLIVWDFIRYAKEQNIPV